MLDDLAYLLGLVCGRGELKLDERQLCIEFPFKSDRAVGVVTDSSQRDSMIIGLDEIVNRLSDFIGKHVKKINKDKSVELVVNFNSDSITWQSINQFFCGKESFKEFTIPDDFFLAQRSWKINFLRGLADSAGFITKGSYDINHRYRMCIEIPFNNWELPIQICRLLQDVDINIPVESILWGHPNIRGKKGWAKEHQIRIYADKFLKIGFTIEYKSQLLKEFAEFNVTKLKPIITKYCSPNNRKVRKKKAINAEEDSPKLNHSIKGIHFDSFWQICRALGCRQCRTSP
jgi:hypothetical protein